MDEQETKATPVTGETASPPVTETPPPPAEETAPPTEEPAAPLPAEPPAAAEPDGSPPAEKRQILPRKLWLTLLLLAAAGLTMSAFSLALSPRGEISWGGSPVLFACNTLPVLLVLALLWLLTGQAWLSCLLTGTVVFLITGGNYYAGEE